MNIYESSEDYLERILMLKEQQEIVISLDVANSLGYTKASVSRAMKNLRENGYIIVNEKGHIDLTQKGYDIASKMLERHHILTSWFEALGISHEVASKDACKIEHDLSDETYVAIKKHLEEQKKN